MREKAGISATGAPTFELAAAVTTSWRTTRQQYREFAALGAAFQSLTSMRAWFDGLGWIELLARCAA